MMKWSTWGGGLAESASTCISAAYYKKNQIHNLECIYCPFPTPLLFLFERGRTNRAWSLEHDVTHKQSDCQVTGEAAPFGPNYSGQTPSIAITTPPSELVPPLLKEKKLPPLHSLKFSVAVLRARSVCLWRWMSDRLGSLLFRPCWGLHIMKGTWGEQEKKRRRVSKTPQLWIPWWSTKVWHGKLNERWKRCLRGDESRWDWKLGS